MTGFQHYHSGRYSHMRNGRFCGRGERVQGFGTILFSSLLLRLCFTILSLLSHLLLHHSSKNVTALRGDWSALGEASAQPQRGGHFGLAALINLTLSCVRLGQSGEEADVEAGEKPARPRVTFPRRESAVGEDEGEGEGGEGDVGRLAPPFFRLSLLFAVPPAAERQTAEEKAVLYFHRPVEHRQRRDVGRRSAK